MHNLELSGTGCTKRLVRENSGELSIRRIEEEEEEEEECH